MEILQSSYATREWARGWGRLPSIFSCYVDLDQASTVYTPPLPRKNQKNQASPQTSLKVSTPPPPPPKKKKIQFYILNFRKSPRMFRNSSPNSPVLRWSPENIHSFIIPPSHPTSLIFLTPPPSRNVESLNTLKRARAHIWKYQSTSANPWAYALFPCLCSFFVDFPLGGLMKL